LLLGILVFSSKCWSESLLNFVCNKLSFQRIFGRLFELSVNGKAVVIDKKKPNELSVAFYGRSNTNQSNYIVVDTDYDNYSIVYSCKKSNSIFNPNSKTEYVWILSRKRTIDEELLDSLLTTLMDLDVNVDKLTKTDQTGCS
jgi:lipocalin